MAVLTVELTFPAAPITSLQKRIEKGIEQLYYTRLFLTSKAYKGEAIWRAWLDLGFHVAIYSPPPGTAAGDRIRVRLRAPSPTPVVSLEGTNSDALGAVEPLLRAVDALRPGLRGKSDDVRAQAFRDSPFGRALVEPVVRTLEGNGFEAPEVEAFVAMLRRGFDALTDDAITAIDIRLS